MDVLDRVAATGLLPAGERVVVLLSGGRDSTALLDCAARLAGPEAVTALHVHHGLRERSADDDVEHCEELCRRLGVALVVEHLSPPDAGNVHAWAREARYAAALRRATQHRARIAVGHTATDQLETVLYRLATSPGRRALLGMAADREHLVRPLLAAQVTREETAAHCLARHLPWREDPSNLDERFARVRVREVLLPALREVDPRAPEAVLRTAELLRDEAEVLDAAVAEVLAPDGDAIERDRLAALHPALARLVLRRLAEDATGRLCGRAASRLDEVLALPDGGALDLGDGARATVAAGRVRVVLSSGRAAPGR